MAEHTAFTAGTANEVDWGYLFRAIAPDGVFQNYLSPGFGDVTVTGTGTVLTIGPHAAMVNGYLYVLDEALVLDAADVGVAPTTGQRRIDLLVYEYDSDRAPADRIQLKLKAGVAATSPVAPEVDAASADLWESEKLRYTWVAGSSIASSSLVPTDRRLGAISFVRKGASMPPAARNRMVVRGNELWVRDDDAVRNSFAYRRLDDPDWIPANLSTSQWEYVSTSRPFQYRFVGGLLQITGKAHKKTSTGGVPTTGWSTVATIPVADLPGVRGDTWTHEAAHAGTGERISWQLVVPASGSASLQVQSPDTSAQTVTLAMFQIPVGV
jgi:hypothetical protein